MSNSFLRSRRLPFESVVLFLIQKSTSSLSVSLYDFFSTQNLPSPTKSSFTQARASLCYKVFKRLTLLVCQLFYEHVNFKKWKGFRILSVDGSTLQLPNHPSLQQKFSRHAFGAKKKVERWMSRISFLYDVLNNIVIDAQMESFNTSESSLCQQHLGFLRKGDLVIFDRYYASHYLFSILLHKKVHFLFRMREQTWRCVKEFLASGLMEQVITVTPYKHSPVALRIPANVNKSVQIRLIKQVNRSGEVRVYATSLLDQHQYSRKSIINLYKQRWGIEEAYKTLKARLDVVNFSGKTVHAVQQDFYARVLLISLTSILKADIKPGLKTKTKTQNKEQRTPVINNSYAIVQTKRLLVKVRFCFDQILHWISHFVHQVKSAIEYSRKGQSSPRKPDRGYGRLQNQNYKSI